MFEGGPQRARSSRVHPACAELPSGLSAELAVPFPPSRAAPVCGSLVEAGRISPETFRDVVEAFQQLPETSGSFPEFPEVSRELPEVSGKLPEASGKFGEASMRAR